MMTRLQVYNDALLLIGERRLQSITEAREPRYLLDQVWDSDIVGLCLEHGLWNFAMRSIKIEYSPSVEPQWGYRRAFDKPTDYVRTAAVCSDEYFRSPLLNYVDEVTFWFSDLDTIYVRYVSNDAAYGADMNKWPRTFAKYVSAAMAMEIVPKVTQDEAKRQSVRKATEDAKLRAKSIDAMNEPTALPPIGTWGASRRGYGPRRRNDGGNTGSLIG